MARNKGFDYDAYKKWYYKQEMVNARAGRPMAYRLMTNQEAKIQYELIKDELKKDVAKGERKAVGNVYQYMAREQATEISYKRAKALYRMAKETNQDVKLEDIRYASEEQLKVMINWDEVKQFKKGLIEEGISIHQANNLVSMYYFGSE